MAFDARDIDLIRGTVKPTAKETLDRTIWIDENDDINIPKYFNKKSKKFVGIKTYDVKDFGAVADGTTDDTNAIQSAIDYVSLEQNGNGQSKTFKGVVFLPSGTYSVSEITIKQGVLLKGESMHTTEIKANDSTKTLIKTSGTPNRFLGIEKISLTGTAISDTNHIGVDLEQSNFNSYLRDVVITDFYTNVKLSDSWDFLIDHCHIHGAIKYNIEAYQIVTSRIINSRIDNAGDHNIYISNSNNALGDTELITITGCQIQYATKSAIHLDKVTQANICFNFIEGNNEAGGYPFINLVSDTTGKATYNLIGNYYTTANNSAANTVAVETSNITSAINAIGENLHSSISTGYKGDGSLRSLNAIGTNNSATTAYDLQSYTALNTLGSFANESGIPSRFRLDIEGNAQFNGTVRSTFKTHNTDPNGSVTTQFVGEELLDTTNNIWYKSYASGNNNWAALN